MKITILTLFESIFCGFFDNSIIKRAIEKKLIDVEVINFRNFSLDKHKKVDDTPYGGGSGMVLMMQPIVDALNSVKTKDSYTILLTPSGAKYHQKMAVDLSKKKHLILISGNYEGFDERILNYVDLQLSVGDFILTNGDIPACLIIDSITRLIPNVISESSLLDESFNENLLDYPVYTKPRDFQGYLVPDVLLSGNHEKINKFRLEERIKKTQKNRIDLYKKYINGGKDNE